MNADVVPARIRWAVEVMGVAPTDRLLEIGCGGGVAVAVICPRLSTGRVTAIDRSETMVERARRRNAANIQSGRAAIHTASLTAADLAAVGLAHERYDKIFAINVNLFWTGPARGELSLIGTLLAPGGQVYLCYDPPGDRADEIADKVTGTLAASGFTVRTTRSPSLLGIIARPGRHAV